MQGHNLTSIIQAAGWPIWPLIVCSIVGLALIAERFWVLRAGKVITPGLQTKVTKLWLQQGPAAALSACGNSVMGKIFAAAIAQTPHEDAMRQAALQTGRLQAAALNKHLSGMIDMFNAQALGPAGQADPSALAGGIAVALYNTAFGLMIAVPALLAWRVLRARVDDLVMQLELGTEQLLNVMTQSRKR
jgi:biopolymer transport protein ExbB